MELWEILLWLFFIGLGSFAFIFVMLSYKPMRESIKFSKLEFKRIMDKLFEKSGNE